MKGERKMFGIPIINICLGCIFSLVVIWLLVTVINAIADPNDLIK